MERQGDGEPPDGVLFRPAIDPAGRLVSGAADRFVPTHRMVTRSPFGASTGEFFTMYDANAPLSSGPPR